MPIYAYACTCGGYAEAFRKIDARHDAPACPDCAAPTTLVIMPARVQSDIQPYQAMAVDVATGKAPMITSRSEHRDFLKRNGLIELGNDVKLPDKPADAPGNIKRDIKMAIEQVRAGAGAKAAEAMTNIFGDR